MASCAKCGNTTFKMVEESPRGSRVKLNFISCATCETVAGVYDIFPLSLVLDRMAKQDAAIKNIAARVGAQVDL